MSFLLRYRAVATLAMLGGALTLGACDRGSEQAAQADQAAVEAPAAPPHPSLSGTIDVSQRGTPAPDVAFTAPDGRTVTLADFRGRPVLVNLWATWCAPCRAEMPTLDALAGREAERMDVLVISQDVQGREIVDLYFAENDFAHLEPYTDTETGMSRAIATGVMPTTVLYDENGVEVWRLLGGFQWNGPRAAAQLEDTLANAAQ